MTKKLNTAVIGLGNIGQHHVRILNQISHLKAISDTNPKSLQKYSQQYSATSYSDYNKLINFENLDAIIIAVPTKFHFQIAVDTLKHKIPTLVEKPITQSLSTAKQLLNIAKQNKVHLSVGHVERFNPAVQKLKQLIQKDYFGDIINLLAIRVGISPPRSPQSDVTLDLAIHDIDVFNYLLESTPDKTVVTKHKINPRNIADSASLLLKYNHTTCLIQANWITPIKRRQLLITGTKGFAELDYIKQKIITFQRNRHQQVRNFHDVVQFSQTTKKAVFSSSREPLKIELQAFLSNIHNQDYNIAESAIKALEVIA